MADFLRKKENNMQDIVGKAYKDLGRELKEVQDELASHDQYKGVFEKWYTALGFAKRTVYAYINYYNVVRQAHEMQAKVDVESLPKKLIYAIGSSNSESTEPKRRAKQAVLNGEVKTLKEYKELERSLHQAEEDKRKLGQLLTEERNKPPEVEYVIDPDTEI
ncbi:hypothetical protein [Bacillus cereus group sp. BfR-BA-01492]|uniref:hypothetical protein n=1 Tax=Bacillus cereus group sp. BfR-BA-01492 TaxID=2920361 RepID=UPI001F5A9B85|nr:hypothetical protein [Bacillus cereus group sp. BfR-BA-01492]